MENEEVLSSDDAAMNRVYVFFSRFWSRLFPGMISTGSHWGTTEAGSFIQAKLEKKMHSNLCLAS
jgi:hypothetical protein